MDDSHLGYIFKKKILKKHTVALPFTLKKSVLLRQKKNYENSNISPCKNIIFKKKKKPKPFKIS